MVSSTASAAAQATGFPPKVLPWSPGLSSSAAAPMPMQAPIGSPPAKPLGQGDHVRPDALGPAGEPGPGPADPALDLVDDQQRAGGVTDLAGRRQIARPAATTTPASPMIGSRKTAAVSDVTASRRASTSPNGTNVTSGSSGSNGARFAG